MTESVNRRLVDVLTTRQIQTARAESTQRREVLAALAVLEADILAALKAADPTEFALLTRRRRAIETLMDEELAPLITARYRRVASTTNAWLLRLARNEVTRVRTLVHEATGEEVLETMPSDATVRHAVEDTLIPTATRPTDLAATGEEWWQRQGDSLTQRLRDQLLVSVSLSETLTQMVARVRGTSEQGFNNGVMAKARDDATRLLRTQVTNAVGEARVALADANEGVMVLEHQSILDSRVSIICLNRAGLRYTVPDHAPINHRIPYLTGTPYHPS